MSPRRSTVPRLLPLGIAAALALGACGSSEGAPELGAEPPPTSSTAEASTTTIVDRGKAVLDAYNESWEAYHAASDPADPAFPGLAETSTGPALQRAMESLRAFELTGQVVRFPEGSIAKRNPQVVSLLGEEATVTDCRVDDSEVIVEATGEVVNDLVGTARYEASMVIETGRWKLRSLTVLEEWEGMAGCALGF